MGKRGAEHTDFSQQSSADQDVVALIKRMQQQLAFLEKKMDILISQTQSMPAGERHFAKPFRAPGRSHRPFAGDRDAFREKKRFERGGRFEKPRGESDHDFGHGRKPFDESRESEGAPEHYFENRRGGAPREFRHKKKSFYDRRKAR